MDARSSVSSFPGLGWLTMVRPDPQTFASRHRVISWVLGAHLPVLVLIAVFGGRGGLHLIGAIPPDQPTWQVWLLWGQIAVVALCTVSANIPTGERARGLVVSVGLLFAMSALLQGLHGLTDLHPYALVLIALIGLYQDWVLLVGSALGLGSLTVLFSWLATDSVYRDELRQDHFWQFGLLYLLLAFGLVVIQMTYWYFSSQVVGGLAEANDEAEQLAMATRHLPDGVVITDLDGVVAWVNPAFSRISGYSAREAIGRTRMSLFRGDAVLQEELEQKLGTVRQGVQTEIETMTAGNRESWLHLQVVPVPSERDPQWLIWLERDITSQHLAKVKTQAKIRRSGNLATALSAEKSLLTSVISTIPHLVYWKDSNLRYRGANDAYLAVRGVDTELDLATRRDDQISGTDPLADLRKLEAQVLVRGESLVDRALVIDERDGSQRTYTVSVLPHRASSGAIDGVIGVGADVTHVTELERHLAQANRLETIGQVAAGIAHEINTPVQFVSDNTRFVTEVVAEVGPVIEQATEVAEGLERATAAISTALMEGTRESEEAGVAQDPGSASGDAVRTLAELTGRLREVLSGVDVVDITEEVGSALSESLEGLDRVAKIVRAMKEFSHPGEDLTDTDLNRAIESTVQVCRNEWKYVANLDLDLDPELGLVPCYVGELQQVLLNMIVNASQAIAERQNDTGDRAQGTIRLTTRGRQDSVEITISDTGAGMDADVVARAFDPFFTTKPVGKGTGQGLALARSCIVGRHEGTIEVESTPMEGTTFVIALPTTRSTGSGREAADGAAENDR